MATLREVILTIEPAAWCDRAAAMLASSIRGAPCYRVGDLRDEIAAGGATLYSVTTDAGELVGYVVLRVERYQGGAEGVIVAAAGKLAGAKLYNQVVPALERLFFGVTSIRVESCRRGAASELQELGYLPTHVVWRKAAPLELAGDDRLEALKACESEPLGGPDLRARPGKLHGGGGGSSSSASNQTTNNVDRRIVADSGAIGISSDSSTVTINSLDAGAINGAIELAKASDQQTTKRLNDVLGVADNVFDKAAGALDRVASLTDRNASIIASAFDRVAGQTDRNASIIAGAYGDVAKAYDSAKGAGDEKTILFAVGLAAVALVAIKVLAK